MNAAESIDRGSESTDPRVSPAADSDVKQLFTLDEAREILRAELPNRRSKRPKRPVETMDFITAARRFMRAAGRRCAEADEVELRALIELIDVEGPKTLQTAVDGIKARGESWAYIARATNGTREAAYQRWGKK